MRPAADTERRKEERKEEREEIGMCGREKRGEIRMYDCINLEEIVMNERKKGK